MFGCRSRRRIRKPAVPPWVSHLLRSRFFDPCEKHGELRKNEKNLFCIDCQLGLCRHCVNVDCSSHDRLHRLLQICKYVYHHVVRVNDIEKHLDCSHIQAYKINGEKAVHLNPRPQMKDTKSSKAKSTVNGGTCCEACGRHMQDFPTRFCSIACKVSKDGDMTMPTVLMFNKVPHLPNAEDVGRNGQRNGCVSSLSLSESSSSEVIQAALRPRPALRKRKGTPRRSPLW